jgi:hypothetical protein
MSMYNSHRGMGPAPGNARLNELLDQIRAEFETQARASGEYEHSSKYCTRSIHLIFVFTCFSHFVERPSAPVALDTKQVLKRYN